LWFRNVGWANENCGTDSQIEIDKRRQDAAAHEDPTPLPKEGNEQAGVPPAEYRLRIAQIAPDLEARDLASGFGAFLPPANN